MALNKRGEWLVVIIIWIVAILAFMIAIDTARTLKCDRLYTKPNGQQVCEIIVIDRPVD